MRQHPVAVMWIAGFAGLIVACAGPEPRHRPTAGSAVTVAVSAAEAAGSIYVLDVDLVDERGVRSHLSDLQGRPIVAAMVYTTCAAVCPRITADVKVVERQLLAAGRTDVTFALFSLDPDRDTPDALRAFARVHSLDTRRWRLFAASQEGVRDLAAVLGIRYKSERDGGIAHSADIVLIDPTGVVRHRQIGPVESSGVILRTLLQSP